MKQKESDVTMNKTILFLLCISLLLTSCGQTMTTVVEDLSKATPTTYIPLDEETALGSSYVKISDQTQPEEVTDDNELEKKVYREGDLVSFEPIGVDPDGDVLTYTFSKPLNEQGEWQTTIGDAGTYQVTITASDGKTEVEKKVILLILSANRAPTIEGLTDLTVNEGELISLDPTIFDYNGDDVQLVYSKPFDENGQWQTTYDDNGIYIVKITVTDEETTVEKQITITVLNTNRAPIIEEIDHVSVLAGDLITLTPIATDPDGDPITCLYSTPVSADGTWQTTKEDVGTYAITVKASDGDLFTEKIVSVIVNHKNKAPVISLDEVRAEETDRIVLEPTIVDPEGDTFTVTYSAPFDAQGVWVTDYDDAGEYMITITATDDNGAASSLDVKVVVYDTNRAPTFQI